MSKLLTASPLASLLVAFALAGCGGADADPSSDTATDTSEQEAVSQEALTGSQVAKKLVGSWQGASSEYPRVELGAKGDYTLDTGIRCITTPCPSGEEGEWALFRGVSGAYYVALFNDAGGSSWYKVKIVSGAPTQLLGVWGTKGKLVPAKSFCVEWQAADEQGNALLAFYAENVKTYEQGKAKLAEIGYFANEAINEGTCAARSQACTKQYAPVCGQVFDEKLETRGNLCELKVAIRQRAGATGAAKGRWSEGECQPEITPCATVRCGWASICVVEDGAAVCVPNTPQPCGATQCAVGTVCCNSSCGICTAPGDVCTQQVCN
ncbi:MAG: hypothetical protein IT374_25300 [Polyangiaceae bacterium]|nr:hypothetical protein [Polyangiaceae bacterium]